jgi:hypothetical protein
MANTARINGFSPVKHIGGHNYNGGATMYAIPTADTTASYAIGDVVQSRGGCDANGVPYIIKVPAANASDFKALGVIVAILPVSAGVTLEGTTLDLTQTYLTAGTRTVVRYAMVCDDPSVIFEVSGGTTATNLTLAKGRYNTGIGSDYSGADQTYAIDQNATVTNRLSPQSPYSNIIVSSATVNTTNTLPIQILGLSQKTGNEVGAYSRLLVRFNNHEFGVATGTNFTGL